MNEVCSRSPLLLFLFISVHFYLILCVSSFFKSYFLFPTAIIHIYLHFFFIFLKMMKILSSFLNEISLCPYWTDRLAYSLSFFFHLLSCFCSQMHKLNKYFEKNSAKRKTK